jgi:hypothetical protein
MSSNHWDTIVDKNIQFGYKARTLNGPMNGRALQEVWNEEEEKGGGSKAAFGQGQCAGRR